VLDSRQAQLSKLRKFVCHLLYGHLSGLGYPLTEVKPNKDA